MTKEGAKPSLSPGRLAWKRFKQNKLALLGLWVLGLAVFLAIFAYPFMPDKTRNANFQIIQLPKQAPGTSFSLLLKPNQAQIEQPSFFSRLFSGVPDQYLPIPIQNEDAVEVKGDSLYYRDLRGQWQRSSLPEFLLPMDKFAEQAIIWQTSGGKPYLLEGDQLQYQGLDGALHQAQLSELEAKLRAQHIQSGHFWLGSDAYGRDQLSRLLLGTRVSLGIGLMAVLVSLLLGVTLGGLAGFFRGKVDQLIMWWVSVVWSIPTLLLAIALAFVLGKGTWQLFLAIGASSWVEVARIVRGQIFSLREMQYIEATKAMGFSSFRTILRHVLPNTLSPLIIVAASNFASAILMEAGLSFLGVGIQPPVPSWGSMIKEGYTQIMFDSGAWLAIFPGLAIIVVVISLNLVGFGLRDALDPKQDR